MHTDTYLQNLGYLICLLFFFLVDHYWCVLAVPELKASWSGWEGFLDPDFSMAFACARD